MRLEMRHGQVPLGRKITLAEARMTDTSKNSEDSSGVMDDLDETERQIGTLRSLLREALSYVAAVREESEEIAEPHSAFHSSALKEHRDLENRIKAALGEREGSE